MMDTILPAILVPLALLLCLVGWLLVICNGQRSMRLRFKGLGVEINISPCNLASCPSSDSKKGIEL